MGFFDTYTGRNINEELEDALEYPNAVILDVRTPFEFKKGHIPGAINIDSRKISMKNQAEVETLLPDKSKKYFSYCKSGGRSGTAAAYLRQMGYDVTNIGGILNYKGEVVK